MNVRPKRTRPIGSPQPMPWRPMKIKYVCQCFHCGVALGVSADAYGRKSEPTNKWLFLCPNCYNNPALPYSQEAVTPPKPTGESEAADENLAALLEATKAALGANETSIPLPDGATMSDVEAIVMEAMATGESAELDSAPTTDEPVVESEAKEEAEPEIDINNPPARLRSMKEIVAYAKYKIKWKAV